MPAPIPNYIPADRISRHEIQHVWDDWDPFEPLPWPEESTKDALKKVSNTGITAFSLGCCEWIIYRLSRFFDDKTPYDYLEAFWVFIMGFDDALPPETENDDWLGKVRGPINLALMTTLNTVYLAEEGPPVQNGALSAQIALHVLEGKSEFLEWQKNVLERLVQFSSREQSNPDGIPIPREVLDPSYELFPNQNEFLIAEFLKNTDFLSNRFLSKIEIPKE